jgi:hypothetical protein
VKIYCGANLNFESGVMFFTQRSRGDAEDAEVGWNFEGAEGFKFFE